MASSNLPPYQPTSKPSKPTTGACISFSRKTTNLYSLVVFLCITSYFLGAWQRGGTTIPSTNSLVSDACSPVLLDINLDFNTHHSLNDAGETLPSINTSKSLYPLCDVSYSEYTPCEDAKRSLRYSRDRLIYRERHCPEKSELLKCRVPAPYGYKNPFAWPKSRDLAWYANVPHKELTVEKAVQNWIRYEGDKFRFPGRGTVEYLESGSRRSSEAFSRSSEYKSESFARRELDRLLEQKQVREVRSMTARLTARAEGSQRASLKEPLDSLLERLRETGTMFPNGANAYINDIGKFINLKDGSIRTAIDTGCGLASWGAYLLSRDILPMSFAPRDTHEAQVQFALERGVPALIGIIASKRLPYPSRAFDVAHCSRCLIPWGQHGGLFLIEVDRVLRPGGYWILSGPPIHWKKYWKGWERTKEDLNAEQTTIENVAKSLCWKKLIEQDDIAIIWQKPTNHLNCKVHRKRLTQNPPFCPAQDADKAWYTEMETCLTTLPEVSNSEEIAGGELAKWPERLYAIPPRVSKGTVSGVTAEVFQLDAELWKKRVSYYKYVNQQLGQAGRYRNVLDMNAHLGGFAAALIDYPLWVMNVVPVEAKVNTLGVIYERGLIGTYQNWCEAMSTYPRTYDLIHADSVFSLYKDRCEMEDILLEMDRILRPEGSVIFRDDVDVVIKIKNVIDRLEWDSVIVDHEDGPHQRGKLLLAVKNYWTAPASDQEELQTAIRA